MKAPEAIRDGSPDAIIREKRNDETLKKQRNLADNEGLKISVMVDIRKCVKKNECYIDSFLVQKCPAENFSDR